MSILISVNFYLNSLDKKDNFLMGSIIKSDLWEIDRKNNIEYFKKNVLFKNPEYLLKSDDAVYYHNEKKWDVMGSVYIKKTFLSGSFLEGYCDKAQYFENSSTAYLHSSTNPVKIVYFDKEFYSAYSKKVVFEQKQRIISFYDSFSLYISSMAAYANKAVYNDNEKTFYLIDLPYVDGKNNQYKTKIRGDSIKILKDEKKVYINGNVNGILIREK